MSKIAKKDGDHSEKMWSLIKNVSGMTFINPNLPALKYGRDMEPLAANRLFNILKVKHKKLKMEKPGLYLDVDKPFIGATLHEKVTFPLHDRW